MRTTSACLLAVAVALSGCGSSDSDSPDGTGSPTVPDDGSPTAPDGGSPTAPGTGSPTAPDDGSPTAPDTGSPTVPDAGGAPGEGTPDEGTPDQGEPATGKLITPSAYEDVLRRVVTVANDDVLNAAADTATPLFETVEPLVREAKADGAASGGGLTFVSSETVDDGPDANFSFSCDGGGTLVGRAYAADDAPGGPFLGQITMSDGCTVDGTGYGGSATRQAITFVRVPDERSYDGFSVTRTDGGSFTLDGAYVDSTPAAEFPSSSFGWTEANYTADEGADEGADGGADGGGSTTRIDGYASSRSAVYGFYRSPDGTPPVFTAPLTNGETATVGEVPHDASAKVTFSVTAPWSSDERLDVAVDLGLSDPAYEFVNVSGGTSDEVPDYPLSDLGSPLVLTNVDTGEQLTIENLPRPDATQWTTGTLAIEAADGSGLVLSPETDDPATFSVAFDDGPDAVTREWSDGFQVSCPRPIVCR